MKPAFFNDSLKYLEWNNFVRHRTGFCLIFWFIKWTYLLFSDKVRSLLCPERNKIWKLMNSLSMLFLQLFFFYISSSWLTCVYSEISSNFQSPAFWCYYHYLRWHRGVGTWGPGPQVFKSALFWWQSALLTRWKMSLRSPFASTAFDLRLHLFYYFGMSGKILLFSEKIMPCPEKLCYFRKKLWYVRKFFCIFQVAESATLQYSTVLAV
jgi:hypothetical protein